MKALVIGATGAVGKDLVHQLLDDESFERVDIFVRREVDIPSSKLFSMWWISTIRRLGRTCFKAMSCSHAWALP